MKVTLVFEFTEVGFQLPCRGYVNVVLLLLMSALHFSLFLPLLLENQQCNGNIACQLLWKLFPCLTINATVVLNWVVDPTWWDPSGLHDSGDTLYGDLPHPVLETGETGVDLADLRLLALDQFLQNLLLFSHHRTELGVHNLRVELASCKGSFGSEKAIFKFNRQHCED